MNSFEKYDKMLSCTPYDDRRDIPVFPMMVASYGKFGGVLQKDLIASADNWLQAVEKTFERFGVPDVSMPMCAGDTAFVMGLPSRLPGKELGDDDLYQFVETPYFDDVAEYDRILQMGYEAWNMEHSMKIHGFNSPQEMGARFGQLGQNLGKTMGYFYSKGVVPCFDASGGCLFDNLSLTRSMAAFTYDLFDVPEKIHDIINTFQPTMTENSVKQAKAQGAKRVSIWAMRSSATFVSPAIWEEFVWPSMKDLMIKYHEAGITSVLHADGNWSPMIPYFLELPKGCLQIELDGDTDIFKAYEILQGYQSMRGDVPATMLAYGSYDDVREYCEKLVQMGMKGGFMLSSGCEVPLNAKPENVQAMMDAVRK
ncbi:MAG: hypothetical protein HUJ75_01405 [Parasporobacterium sp.]|nr:hypothetical protein [Parasporobacterium sp.]